MSEISPITQPSFALKEVSKAKPVKHLSAAKRMRKTILRIALVVFFVAFTIYIGLGSTTVLLPIPHLAFTFTMGSVSTLMPWLIGLSAGFGDSLGELWGYLAGYAVEDLVDRWRVYPKIEGWVREHGMLTIFLMGAVPMPLFDMAGMAAGATEMPVWKFYLATWSGKTIKAIVVAWAGRYSIAWIANLLGL
jgi:uncharacterized membrane protein YdjX (TVP38/TMEM64 family)